MYDEQANGKRASATEIKGEKPRDRAKSVPAYRGAKEARQKKAAQNEKTERKGSCF